MLNFKSLKVAALENIYFPSVASDASGRRILNTDHAATPHKPSPQHYSKILKTEAFEDIYFSSVASEASR